MDSRSETTDVAIELNSDSFIVADSKVVSRRIQAESELNVRSYMYSAAVIEGGPLAADIVLQVAASALPLADVYVNLISSAIYDLLKTARLRQGRGENSEGIFQVVAGDDIGNITHTARVQTSDPELIKQLMQDANDAAARSSEGN